MKATQTVSHRLCYADFNLGTIVGERDASFNHVSTGGYNAVLECVSSAHPLRSKILSYYKQYGNKCSESHQSAELLHKVKRFCKGK
jgi:hypothetical protein